MRNIEPPDYEAFADWGYKVCEDQDLACDTCKVVWSKHDDACEYELPVDELNRIYDREQDEAKIIEYEGTL